MKERIINWLLKYLLCSVDPYQVVQQTKNGELIIQNEKLTKTEIRNLKEEIKYIKNTRIWIMFTETLKDQAKQIMFEKAVTFDDMKSGKMMLYNLSIQEKIMKIIEDQKI